MLVYDDDLFIVAKWYEIVLVLVHLCSRHDNKVSWNLMWFTIFLPTPVSHSCKQTKPIVTGEVILKNSSIVKENRLVQFIPHTARTSPASVYCLQLTDQTRHCIQTNRCQHGHFSIVGARGTRQQMYHSKGHQIKWAFPGCDRKVDLQQTVPLQLSPNLDSVGDSQRQMHQCNQQLTYAKYIDPKATF